MITSLQSDTFPEVMRPTCAVSKVLQGQKALGIGANSGIGPGVALALGQASADMVVNYVAGDAAAEQVVEEIKCSGVQACNIQDSKGGV